MKISSTHQEFADELGYQRAIDHPDEFLGPNWKDVLNFWLFIDTLTKEQMWFIEDLYGGLYRGFRVACFRAARVAAIEATNQYVIDAVYQSTFPFVSLRAATHELICSHILKEQGKSLVFFPMFLNV